MKTTNKNGFSKSKLLIILGVFVLVVVISIPIGFGFNKEDHPEISATETPTTENEYPETHLGIVDKIFPNKNYEFEDNIPAQDETRPNVDKEENISQKPTTPSKTPSIEGVADVLETNTEVKNQGVVEKDTPKTDKYEEVEATVVPETTTPPPQVCVPVRPSEPEEKEELLPIPENCDVNLRKVIEKLRAMGYGQIVLDDNGDIIRYQTNENTWVEIIKKVDSDQISDELADLFG